MTPPGLLSQQIHQILKVNPFHFLPPITDSSIYFHFFLIQSSSVSRQIPPLVPAIGRTVVKSVRFPDFSILAQPCDRANNLYSYHSPSSTVPSNTITGSLYSPITSSPLIKFRTLHPIPSRHQIYLSSTYHITGLYHCNALDTDSNSSDTGHTQIT